MSTHASPAAERHFARRWFTPWRAGIAAVVAVAAVVAIFLVVNGNNNGSSGSGIAGGLKAGVPRIMSVAQLRAFAADASGPVYWLRPGRSTARLEVTATSNGDVFIRYLTGTAQAGDPQPIFTSVGTYGLTNAYKVVLGDSRLKGASLVAAPGGGIGVHTSRAPDSYYVAFPGQNFVAEVFNPSPQAARRLVASGRLAPIR